MQDDPKSVAVRLLRRQETLNRDIDQAIQSAAGKTMTAEEKTAFAARLKPLEVRERAIAELAKSIKPPAGKEGRARFPHEAARDAAAKTLRAAETLSSQKPQEIMDRKNEALQSLGRLSVEMHDQWRRQEFTRQQFNDARRQSYEVGEEISRNMRETDPRADRPATTSGAAAELAGRLSSTVDKQARVVAALEAMEPEPRLEPQRQRALSRAKTLAGVLRDLRDQNRREQARASLKDTETAARAGMDRLEQKLSGRVPPDDVAQELADDARAIENAVTASGRGERDMTQRRIAERQRALAGAIRNLVVPDAAAAHEDAIRTAERAAAALETGRPKADAAAALRDSARAAQALEAKLTDRQKTVVPPSQAAAEPELALKPEHAARAEELARRERRIRERFQALLGERVGSQQEIRKDAVTLGEELTDLRDRLRNVSDRAHYPAHEAANHVGNHAPQAIDQGVGHLAGGQAHAAREDERRAAVLLERGAELAEDVAAAIRADLPEGHAAAKAKEAGGDRSRAGEALGDARDEMRRASRELDQAREPAQAGNAGALARQSMEKAARDLVSAADLAAAELGPGFAGLLEAGDSSLPADADSGAGDRAAHTAGRTPDPESGPGGKAEADLTELKALIRQKTGRNWGELPGHLRNEILKMQAGRYRDDYARIIQLYFREIAAGSGSSEPTKP